MKLKYPKKIKNVNVLSVNILTLILSIIFLIVGSKTQNRNFFGGTAFIEIFVILIPALFLIKNDNVFEVLRMKKLSFKNIIRVIIITILTYPIILLLNGIFLSIISQFVELKNASINLLFKNETFMNYFIFLCILPAFCEEVFFRGTLLNAYDIYGRKFAILMSSLVFALFHFDIQNGIAPFLLGLLFANLLEMTGSLYSSILSHFTNNLIAFASTKYLYDFIFKYFKNTRLLTYIGSLQLLIILVLIVISVFSCIILKYLFNKMNKERQVLIEEGQMPIVTKYIRTVNIFDFLPIIALVILYCIYYLIEF